jgi:mRNA-degrading endonuclease RelE of RelBE toxin-antitoxin system
MKVWNDIILPKAEKRLERMPRQERERVLKVLYEPRNGPLRHDFKPLQDLPFWRLRVGSWRIHCRVERKEMYIYVLTIGPRGDVYK